MPIDSVDNNKAYAIRGISGGAIGAGVGAAVGATSIANAKKFISNFICMEDSDWFERAKNFAKEQGDAADRLVKRGNFKGEMINGKPAICGIGASDKTISVTKEQFEKLIDMCKNKGKTVAKNIAIFGGIGVAIGLASKVLSSYFNKNQKSE